MDFCQFEAQHTHFLQHSRRQEGEGSTGNGRACLPSLSADDAAEFLRKSSETGGNDIFPFELLESLKTIAQITSRKQSHYASDPTQNSYIYPERHLGAEHRENLRD